MLLPCVHRDGPVGLALELGKVGLIQLTLELLREKKSGKQPEILQLLLFFLCRMCLVGTRMSPCPPPPCAFPTAYMRP
jgi:hypothetical protein